MALYPSDSTYIAGTVTDDLGKFLLEIPPETQRVILSVEAIGYEKTALITGVSDDITIKLSHNGITLSEVVVNPPKLSVSPGRFSFLPGDILKDVTNAYDVFKHVPLLRATENGALSIIGKEKCKIFINGKESIMSNDAIVNMLRASEPNRIKKIEVWLQPSISRLDEGSIINIVLAPAIGMMGSADLQTSYTTGIYARESGQLNIERDRWQFSSSLAFIEKHSKTGYISDYIRHTDGSDGSNGTPSSPDISQYSWIKSKTSNTSKKSLLIAPSIGASLDLRHNNSISIYAFTNLQSSTSDATDIIDILPQGESSFIKGKNKQSLIPFWNLARLNYDHTLDSLGSRIQASAIYTGYITREDNSYTPIDAMTGYKNNNDINSIQLKGSWTKRFSTKASLETGFDTFYDKLTYKLDQSADGSTSGILTRVDDLTQQQSQLEVFASMEYNFSSVFGLSAGLRARWYHRDMTQHVQSTKSDFNDTYLLPVASASFSFSPMHMVTLTYNTAVQQPVYYEVNPIAYWLTPEYYYTGNPSLKAQYSHTLSLYYALLQKITLGGDIKFTSNISARATIPMENGITYYMPLEVGHSRESSVFAGYSDSFFSRRLNVYGRVTWTQMHIVNDNLPLSVAPAVENDSRWDFMADVSVSVGSDRSWNIGATVMYDPAKHATFYNSNSHTNLNFYLSKRFDFGGRLQLGVYDILNQKSRVWYDCDTYSQTLRHTEDTRCILVQFTYNFGKPFRMRRTPSYSEFGRH